MFMRTAVFCLRQADGRDGFHGLWDSAGSQENCRPVFINSWIQMTITGPVFHDTGDLNQMERKEKGLLYRVGDPEIRKLQNRQLVLLADYNRMDLADWTSRRALLKELFASFGEDSCCGKDLCKLGRMFLPCGESRVYQFQSDHGG